MSAIVQNDVLISLDIDWASDEIIEDSLRLLNERGIRATLFLTGRTGVDLTGHEIALHPNYVGPDLESPVAELLSLFPDAEGVRSHALFFSYGLVDVYERLGIRYQSNVLAYKQEALRPFQISRKVAEIPIYFMDTIQLMMEPEQTLFDPRDLGLESPGLKVFDFHPIHIYLNTDCMARYTKAKPFYHQPRDLELLRNRDRPGVRNLFIGLLDALVTQQNATGPIGPWLKREFNWTFS